MHCKGVDLVSLKKLLVIYKIFGHIFIGYNRSFLEAQKYEK